MPWWSAPQHPCCDGLEHCTAGNPARLSHPNGTPPAIYRRVHLSVGPFEDVASGGQEGVGLALVEAAGCGCPVLAGDVFTVQDVVWSIEIGVVAVPTNHNELARAVVQQLPHPSGRDADLIRARSMFELDRSRRAAAHGSLLANVAKEAAR